VNDGVELEPAASDPPVSSEAAVGLTTPEAFVDGAPVGEPPPPGVGDTPPIGLGRRRRRVATEWLVVLVAALLLALGIRAYAVQAFFIPSASMEPTLNIGDRLLVDKALFDYHHLKEGDIIVFHQPPADTMCGPPETDLVKRVIGLPGQSIYSLGNNVYVDGHRLTESYLPKNDELGPQIAPKAHPFKVPADQFYVMGDNRAISCDSRYWGTVKGSSIVGKAVLLWWHNGHPDLHFF
jgi:signal peptidase I